MTSNKTLGILITFVLFLFMAGCGGGGGGAQPQPAPPPLLVSVTVRPATANYTVGTVAVFSALATYSDNSTADVTATATWTSSNPAVATVSNAAGSKGTVTAVAEGSATITASLVDAAGTTVSGSATVNVTSDSIAPAANVMEVTVNGGLCNPDTSANYLNKPCVSVTVCTPGTNTCVVVNDILLDTGSYGLRIFSQAIPSLTLPPVTVSTAGTLVGCVQFADGSSLWGPIRTATVKMGSEPAVDIPIQVIDSTFSQPSTGCANADPTPVAAQFNGILGVGLFAQDCGPDCVTRANNRIYFDCVGQTCTGTTVPLALQVQNPVASLPVDNNGLQVLLPAVPPGGVRSINGSVIFGIATQANNGAGSPTVLTTDDNGEFTTLYPTSGNRNSSFLDTGSNALFIPNNNSSVLPPCASPNQGWYCPPVTRAILATAVGTNGVTADVQFNVSNAVSLFSLLQTGTASVFSDVAGKSSFGFDWGLPFFMGRKVFYGYDGKQTPLGVGPLVAF